MRVVKNHIKLGKLALALVILLSFAAWAQAATYYVNGSGAPYVGTQGTYAVPTGSGTGTLADPYLSLVYAESQVSDGHTVYVAAGTYTEDDASRHNWKTVDAIAWIADGTVIVKAVTTTTGVIELTGADTQSFTGFTFDMETDNDYGVYNHGGTRTFTNCIFINPKSTGYIFYAYEAITAWNIVNCSVYGANPSEAAACGAVFFTGIAPVTVTGGTYRASGNYFFADLAGSESAFTITGATVYWTVTTGARCFYLQGSTALTVGGSGAGQGNIITLAGTNVILVEASAAAKTGAITISGNTVSSSAQHANVCLINNGTHTTIITGNSFSFSHAASTTALCRVLNQPAVTITNNSFSTLATTSVAHLRITSSGTDGDNAVITGNTFRTRSAGDGYCIVFGTEADPEATGAGDGKFDGANISNNLFYGPLYYDTSITNATIHNVLFSHSINATFNRNYVNGMAYGFVAKGSPSVWSGGGVTNNIFVNCVGEGTAAVRIKGAQNVPVYNNTGIVESTITGVSAPFIRITQNGAGQEATGTIVKNNLFSAPAAPMVYVDADALTDFVCENNGYFRHGGSAVSFSADGGSSTINWAAWNALGYDTPGGFNADPLLSATYTLQDGSPAIGAGVLITGLHDQASAAKDFAGVDVTWGPSIGAYQPTGTAPNWANLNGAKLLRASQAVTITGDHSAETLDLSNAANTGTLTVSGTFKVGKIIGNAAVPIVGSGAKINGAIELGNNVNMSRIPIVHE